MTDSDMRDETNQVDIGLILEELRAEIRARRLSLGQAESSPLERDLQRSLDEIELHRVVSAHWPLIGKTVPQRVMALLNKLVRRYLRWYINPIVEQQNAYNDVVARTLRLLADAYSDLGEQIRNVEQRNGGSDVDQRPTTNDQRPTEDRETRDKRRGTRDNRQPTTDNLQSAICNLQSTMDNLKSKIQHMAADEPPARFPDLELRELEPQLRLRLAVTAHWPLSGSTLSQRVMALLNKLVRRYLRWYINPIVEQQNAANAALAAALLALVRLDAQRRAEVAALRAAKVKGTR